MVKNMFIMHDREVWGTVQAHTVYVCVDVLLVGIIHEISSKRLECTSALYTAVKHDTIDGTCTRFLPMAEVLCF